MVQCQACGGTYEPVSADGVPYVHVCAPVTCATVTRGGTKMLAPLGKIQPTDTVTVLRAGAPVAVLVSALQPGDLRQGDTLVERSNKRDETIIGYQDPATRKIPILKCEGLGAKPIAAPVVVALPLTDPV